MRKSYTAVLEQSSTFTESFSTEPYEVGWASEARWFLNVQELSGGDVKVEVRAEISPDGLVWCAAESAPLHIAEEKLYSFAMRDFGHWLRLSAHLTGQEPRVKLLIYLALKE